MAKPRTVTGSVAASVVATAFMVALTACGGGGAAESKPPETPASSSKDPDEVTPAAGSPASHASSDSTPSSSDSSATSDSAPSGGKTPYDKDAVEAQLKRGARSVKAACGAATDDQGQANGPWGKTTAKITLGRNGHVKGVAVPSPYDGTPVGECVVHAFDKIQFPPYAAPSDVAVDWDVDIVKPKK